MGRSEDAGVVRLHLHHAGIKRARRYFHAQGALMENEKGFFPSSDHGLTHAAGVFAQQVVDCA